MKRLLTDWVAVPLLAAIWIPIVLTVRKCRALRDRWFPE